MENLITTFSAQPIYLVIFIVLALFVVYSLVKKVIKLMIFGLFVLGIYIGYVVYTGRSVPTDTESLKNALIEDADKAKQGLQKQSDKLIEKAKEGVKEEIKKEAKEELNNLQNPPKKEETTE